MPLVTGNGNPADSFSMAAENRSSSKKGAQLEVNVKDRVPKKDQIFQGEQKRPRSHALMARRPI